MRALRFCGFVMGAALAGFAWNATAEAQLEACGNIHVEADATCELEVEGGCTAMCEPVRVQAACAAELYASCEGGCDIDIDASCMASCDFAGCMARCDVDPGSFRCDAYCEAEASASCQSQCSSSDNRTRCESSCEATFAAECRARCEIEPPSATCEARCQASCEGSCRAEANVDCQVDCQADLYVDCETRVSGGCRARCTEPNGALFCDGQYVDHGGNLQMCVDALNDLLAIDIEVTASGSCTGSMCEARVDATCAAAPGAGEGSTAVGATLLLSLVGFVAARRRRRR
ncbi:MAG: hypothetical protein IT379_31410 [Deltaproteobacteria bacterium]|nr:hypothetical protein [Deltaproteobacteria bacterium]